MNKIYYFGCIGEPGHFLWDPDGGRVTGRVERQRVRQPWGDSIDGAVFPGRQPYGKAGLVHATSKGGWTAVGWADYSVDSRPGSHSTFLVHADVPPQELVDLARQAWPKVFSRSGFPELKFM